MTCKLWWWLPIQLYTRKFMVASYVWINRDLDLGARCLSWRATKRLHSKCIYLWRSLCLPVYVRAHTTASAVRISSNKTKKKKNNNHELNGCCLLLRPGVRPKTGFRSQWKIAIISNNMCVEFVYSGMECSFVLGVVCVIARDKGKKRETHIIIIIIWSTCALVWMRQLSFSTVRKMRPNSD